MRLNGAIKQAQKVLSDKSKMSKSDVLYLISLITIDSTYEQKRDGARLLRENVSLFGALEFNSIVSDFINRTGFKPRN